MSGRCYGCGEGFKKFFSGEKGCKNCGFEFCKKCITKTIAIPKMKNEVHHVCDKCYRLLSQGKKVSKQRPASPPKAFTKRMEALEKKEAKGLSTSGSGGSPKSSPRQNNSKSDKKYAGMETVDADLMRRFDKLKEDREKNTHRPDTKEIEKRLAGLKAGKPEPPSEQEIRNRLAALQGKQENYESQGKHYFPPERRTQEEQIVDLMDELFDEHQIEQRQHGNQTDDTTVRPNLATGSNNQNFSLNSNDPDIKEINALIEKSAKELQLDAENAIVSLQQDKELMARLHELKKKKKDNEETDTRSPDSEKPIHSIDDEDNDDDNNDDVLAEKLIKQYLEEAKLDEAAATANARRQELTATDDRPAGTIPDVYKAENEQEEEYPWCCICSDEAKIRCIDCDGDLFCAQCFCEGHKDSYMKDHEFERYKKTK